MHYLRFLILFIVLNTGPFASGQGTREIRSVYKRIQKELPLYASKTIPVFEMSTEGGEVTGYCKDSAVQKLSAVFLGETGRWFQEYYYKDKKLVFVLAIRHSYNRPMYYNAETAKEYGEEEYFDDKKTKITEERFYLQNNSIFKWLSDDVKNADVSLEDKNTKTEELLSTSVKLQELLTNYKEED